MSDASGFAILPAIDLRGGRVVRLRQGDFGRETAYSDDPVEVATRFADAGAQWLHVVDLDGARAGSPAHGETIEAIVKAVRRRTSVEVAGGMRDGHTVATVLDSGAARVVVGTAALREPAFAARLVSTHGSEQIVVAIDVRAGRAIGQGWAQDAAGRDHAEAIVVLADSGVTTFEVTAIDRDGLLGGPDLPMYKRLVEMERGSIVASGGIASIDDLLAVRALGCSGAIIGRAIYEGHVELAEALDLTRRPTSETGP